MRHEVRVPLVWHWIEKVRDTVSDVLASESEDLREAAVMVASELAENLVKYGKPIDGEDSGQVSVELSNGVITILSENGTTKDQAERVIALVDAIGAADDVAALYVSRLASMAATPTESASELGLLRIAFEGGFALACDFAPPRLIVSASRKTVQ